MPETRSPPPQHLVPYLPMNHGEQEEEREQEEKEQEEQEEREEKEEEEEQEQEQEQEPSLEEGLRWLVEEDLWLGDGGCVIQPMEKEQRAIRRTKKVLYVISPTGEVR